MLASIEYGPELGAVSQEEQFELSDAAKMSAMLSEATVKLIGDRATLCQTIQLLAYVRHALRDGQPAQLKVDLCSKVADGKLMFEVNGLEIPDLIPPRRIEID